MIRTEIFNFKRLNGLFVLYFNSEIPVRRLEMINYIILVCLKSIGGIDQL